MKKGVLLLPGGNQAEALVVVADAWVAAAAGC